MADETHPDAAGDELGRLRAEVAGLRHTVAGLADSIAALRPDAGGVGQRLRVEQLDVERLNVVEPDGTPRLVLSSRDRAPDPTVDGTSFKRPDGNPPGLLFYNDEGDECGGLIFNGQRREDGGYGAGAHLLFDQYKQDQAIGLQYQDSDGERRLGLFVSDWAVIPGSARLGMIARWEAVRALPPGPERDRAMGDLRAGGFFPAPRVFVGRERDGTAVVRLCDAQGRVRLRLAVDAEGTPALEFLDEQGHPTGGLPAPPPPPPPPAGPE